jgi:hypothetical protein
MDFWLILSLPEHQGALKARIRKKRHPECEEQLGIKRKLCRRGRAQTWISSFWSKKTPFPLAFAHTALLGENLIHIIVNTN